MRLDRVVVGDQHRESAVGDPLQQLGVAAVEDGAGLIQHRGVGLPAHADHRLREAGVQAHHVAGLDLDAIGVEDAHQRVVADDRAARAEVRVQVDHHAAALHAALGHVLDAERDGARGRAAVAPRRHAGVGRVGGREDVAAGAVAVVVDRFGDTVAVGVEQLADVGEAVPLRRVLQVHHHQVVADHVGVQRVVGDEPVVHVRLAVAHGRTKQPAGGGAD
jgi:hypothetical protein